MRRWLQALMISLVLVGNCHSATIDGKTHTSQQKAQLWNLQDADIRSVIDQVSRVTGKNFIVSSRVQGKVSVVSSTPLKPDELYHVFLAILQVNGYVAIPSGHVVKILPALYGNQYNKHMAKGKHRYVGDDLVVRVVPVHYNSAEQLLPILRPMLPSTSNVSVYLPTNTIILSGPASQVNHLAELISKLDKANGKGTDIINLHYAIAADVVKELQSLEKSSNTPGNPTITLTADDRSNSVLIHANYAQRQHMQQLIKKLDKQFSNTSGNSQVIFLHYMKASQMVPILGGIAKATYGGSDVKVEKSQSQANNNGAKLLTQGNTNTSNLSSSSAPNASTSNTTSSNFAAQQQLEPIVSYSLSGKGTKVEIESEPASNALIITAPTNLMQNLKSIIARLDIRPVQVLVEAVVVEITSSKLNQLGIEWGQVGDGSKLSSVKNELDLGLGVGFIHGGDLQAMINALHQDSRADILSTPNVVVLDNQPAQLEVGQVLGFKTAGYQTSSSDSSTNPYDTYERQFVGLHLNVLPQVNQGDAVRLIINQGNETLADGAKVTDDNPTTNKSEMTTSVIVNDGDTLVLGGLMSNQNSVVTNKVPLLGDIPGVGLLFTSQENQLEKRNLVVFIRPIILHNEQDNVRVTNGKYQFAKSQLDVRAKRPDALGFNDHPTLPAINADGMPVLPKPFD